jgi:hypothetical protein
MTSTTGDLFPAQYSTGRAGFLAETAAAGAQLESRPHPVGGPNGEELAVDVARFGDAEARRVLVIGSGTHGVEGRCGSGIQRALVEDGLFRELPAGIAVLLVHGINPYGFAFDRRVDHANIDVNRNFVDHPVEHPDNPAYEGLYDVLNPTDIESEESDGWISAITEYGNEHGPLALFQATMGGQYQHPTGMQFGGMDRSWSNTTLEEIWTRHLADAELAINIDLHSGLGPEGAATLMQTADVGEPAADRAAAWFDGVQRYDRPVDDESLSRGGVGLGFDAAAQADQTVAVLLEFGTRDPLTVLGAVRSDNWLEHHGDRRSPQGQQIAERMRSAFFVDDIPWRQRVVDQAHHIVTGALDALVTD